MNKNYIIFLVSFVLLAWYIWFKELQTIDIRAEKEMIEHKYNDKERTKLEENLKQIILLRDENEKLFESITIKEDWMTNPQKRRYVQDGSLFEF